MKKLSTGEAPLWVSGTSSSNIQVEDGWREYYIRVQLLNEIHELPDPLEAAQSADRWPIEKVKEHPEHNSMMDVACERVRFLKPAFVGTQPSACRAHRMLHSANTDTRNMLRI